MLLSFVPVQVGTEVACFQQDPRLRMHIQQLGKQMSCSTEVLFLEYKLLNFVVKMSTVISLGGYARDMVFPQKFLVNMNS